ncbi:FecR family protein [Congregibacter litoralis]|uniref:FecR family protein n=1 Tax=Congregibacter litoralis KT71 TaxID=314285 RepID=A4AAF2_9GAMM|nr:FecR family protein [Congregibacter litoralis]EAQ97029.2 FecR family protein [Congregibacter litoralis KT71]
MPQTDHNDEDLSKLLRFGGAREELPEHLKLKWEQHTREELAKVQLDRRQRKSHYFRKLSAIAATVVAVAIGSTYLLQSTDTTEVYAVLLHAEGECAVEYAKSDTKNTVEPVLANNSDAVTGEDSFITFTYRDHEVRINENTNVKIMTDELVLLEGEIYISDDLDSSFQSNSQSIFLRTPHGSIRDIGTQFLVRASAERTEATVRNGKIRVDDGESEVEISARSREARQATLGASSTIEIISADARGSQWDWIYNAREGFAIDGRSALELLEWAAKEMGASLEFLSAAAERRAEFSILRGNVIVTNPQNTIDVVLESSELRAKLSENGVLTVWRAERDIQSGLTVTSS